MEVGDLVRMKDDSFKIMGVIVRVFMDDHYCREVYKIVWINDLCDPSYPSYATKDNLEAVCKLVI